MRCCSNRVGLLRSFASVLALATFAALPRNARADHEGGGLFLGSAIVGVTAIPGLISAGVNTAIAVRSGFERTWKTFGEVSAVLNIAASVFAIAGAFTFYRNYLGEVHPAIVAWGVGHLGIGIWNIIGASSQKEAPPRQTIGVGPFIAPTQRGGIAAGLSLSIGL